MKIMEGKVALVTGAASGLGLATAKAFTEAGASVALADRDEESVRAAARKLAEPYQPLDGWMRPTIMLLRGSTHRAPGPAGRNCQRRAMAM